MSFFVIVQPILIVYILKVDSMLAHLILIQSMMPSITLASILFTKYHKDAEFGAIVTITSTILSLPTIPLMYFLLTKTFTFIL